ALLVPALLALTLGCWQALLVGWTAISAEHAARAAARARLIGAPVQPAAAGAVPGAMRGAMQVRTSDGSVSVRVSVPRVIPGFSLSLTADAPVVEQ
ncbi:MAG TPA: TadE/TadG family type IV pilus assembly protein, partial [Gaiellales bacterium]|nr:TadE/TadG family type IV pilus assembly protein [Gaiellales bacterium]